MITLNGNKFAETDSEFVDSLFTDKTCNGMAKRFKRKIDLFNPQGEKVGVINKHGALCCATQLDDGQYWYNFATIKEVGEYDSYMQSVEDIDALTIAHDRIGRRFK